MRREARYRRRRARLALAGLCAVGLIALLLAGSGGAGAVSGELGGQPVFGTPAGRFLGASPAEAGGEAWALSRRAAKVVRYRDGEGWVTMPGPFGLEGQALAGLEFLPGVLSGRSTPAGGIAIAARDDAGQLLIVRDPGGDLHAAPEPGAAVLFAGEQLFGEQEATSVVVAPVDESGGRTGAFLVPATELPAQQETVLAFDGDGWSREPICVGVGAPTCTAPPPAFHALAIDATGPGNAWMLARGAIPGEGLELFQRASAPGGGPAWLQRRLGPEGSLGARFGQGSSGGVTVAARAVGQSLTVTSAGVWLDARLTAGPESADATIYFDLAQSKVTAGWCDLAAAPDLCTYPLGSELAGGEGRSFAWEPGGGNEPYGRRYVTGLGQGVVLALDGSGFERLSLAGGNAGGSEGAALDRTAEGWLGSSPPVHVTRSPEPVRLAPWPVPFRRPLTAIAPEPEAPVAALGSEALAVGSEGQVARYLPGQGWVAEPLLTGSGVRAKPLLRGVAWPVPDRAYAVGDGAAMWLWQAATGLWQPDPAEPPNLVRANFTGIAFDPGQPNRGYAVGKQGVLLAYSRQWQQEQLPAGVDPEVNFTSVAFAGDEALATYKLPFDKNGSPAYTGGVLVNDGSGWTVDEGAAAALAGAVPQRVAGLADGGAVVAADEGGDVSVIERQGAGGSWEAVGGGPAGYPAALAAIREDGRVRALMTISPGQGQEDIGTDFEQVFNRPPPGSPPLLTASYPLPGSGFLIRQTASGWRDEEHQAFPLPARVEGQTFYDLPRRPDPLLALLVSPDGSYGWGVGGETGTSVRFQGNSIQTAGVVRYGPEAAPPSNSAPAPVEPEAGRATFAIGGGAQCAGPCADLGATGIGPEVWLRAAVSRAAAVPGLRAFLYVGAGVAPGRGPNPSERLASEIAPVAFQREEAAYARRLSPGGPPVFAAPAASDLDRSGSLATFAEAFAGFPQPLGAAQPPAGITPRAASPSGGYYAFDSTGSGIPVRVIVLDYSAPTLGATQSCWLAERLSEAAGDGRAAIVAGERDLAGQAPNQAADAPAVTAILVGREPPASLGCAAAAPAAASAYFFDYPEQNRAYRLTSGGRSIPAFGSGTLGYLVPRRPQETDYVGASGFLLASVSERDPATNVAKVRVRLIPNIGALALDSSDGTVVRRSQPALFEALARRPVAGGECSGNFAPGTCEALRPDPYVPIPSRCLGQRCASGVLPEYAFSSSEPDIADFVASDPGSTDPRHVLLVDGKPVLDPHSGLLCAFNAGTTTVTVSTGGLSYSQQVTVLGGSPQRPCGTTPLRRRAALEPEVAPPLAPEGSPGLTEGPTPVTPPPPPGVAPAPIPTPVIHHPPPPSPVASAVPFFAPPLPAVPVTPIVPPPPAPAAQPTPPSGTSPVTSVVNEREEEAAFDLVHHMARFRHPVPTSTAGSAPGGLGYLVPGLVALLALAAAGGIRGRPRHSPEPQYAHQTHSHRRHR